MALEIERKFLVNRDRLPALTDPTLIRQAYIPTANGITVRVRLAGEQAMLAVKTKAVGLTRHEYEFPIPVADAREMLEKVCGTRLVEKQRYLVNHGGMTWEIDVFEGSNDGLIVAEIELDREDREVDLPDWTVDEVTHDSRYSNFSLATCPYSDWIE
jgi:adenylate cyclase